MSSVRFRYQTIGFSDSDIHVRTLWDRQQFSDPDGEAERLGISSAMWSLSGVIWPAGMVLAHMMCDYELNGQRILEVGCGIGLASLRLNQRGADITATDYHPEVGRFLQENVRINGGEEIPFVCTDWSGPASDLGLFDLIIGSDLLYEPAHAKWLAVFIDQHAKSTCTAMIIDGARGHQGRFTKLMIGLGFDHSRSKPQDTDYLSEPFRGNVLLYSRE